ncbi:MAG: peptide chain release factor N(5)-glutamine methyltransferase [Pseudomonadota bacterium]
MTATYAQLLLAATQHLQTVGISSPAYEARQLVLLASGLTAEGLIAREQDDATPAHRAALTELLDQRAARRPLAHLSGWVDFYGLRLKSDARALIPRSDSECVVDVALARIPEQAEWRIADLGTGSGALLAALLHSRPSVCGTAIEASAEAGALAQENFDHLDLTDRAELFIGSWAAWTGWERCDLIVSNPPYIRSETLLTLEPEVRDFDPRKALDGGQDGLACYRNMLARAAEHMRAGTHLVLEIGYDQNQPVSDLLKQHGFADLSHHRDLGGNDRVIAASKT